MNIKLVIINYILKMGGKNKQGGKKFKSQKKVNSNGRELIFREDDQAYARLVKALGDARYECEILNIQETRIGHIKGTFRKRIWMNIGDIVLVSLRDFDKSKCDIIYKYTPDEALSLQNYGEILEKINLQASNFELQNGIGEFEDDNDIRFEEI